MKVASATADVLATVNRFVLPAPEGGARDLARGLDVDRRLGSSILDAATRLGAVAARRFNQYAAAGRPQA